MTAGALVGFIFLTYRFLEPIAEFTEVLDQTQTAVAGLRRVLGVLDIPVGPPPPAHPQPLPPGRFSIDIDEVTFSYRSRGDRALRRTTSCSSTSRRSSPPGSRWRWSAATGSGKTTLGPHRRPLRRPDRRSGPAGRRAAGAGRQRRAAPAAGRRRPGAVPVRRHDRQQHPVRPARARPAARSSDSSISSTSADWLDDAARRSRHAGRRARRLAVGRRASAGRPAAGRCRRSRRAGARRGDLVGRRPHRGAHLARPRASSPRGAPRSPSPTACRPPPAPTGCSCSTRGRLVEDGHHDELVAAGGTYSRLYDAWLSATDARSDTALLRRRHRRAGR